MGDIAAAMLDGTLCECCGCIHEDLIIPGSIYLKEPPGYPRRCKDCETSKDDDKPRPGAWKKKRKR